MAGEAAAHRLYRAKMTWKANRQLVHAGRRRSAWLAFRALFTKPPVTDNREESRLRSV